MASFKALMGNKCMSNKSFIKKLKQGQKLTIEVVETKSNQYGGDDVLGISFKETSGFLRLNTSNGMTLANKYGDDYDKWAGKKCNIAWRAREVEGKDTQEIILTVD